MTFDTFEHRLWPLMVGKGMPDAEDAKSGSLATVQASKDLLEKDYKVFHEIVGRGIFVVE